MKKATISEIKNNLSAYLKKVRAGEVVVILDREEPVARIERVTAHDLPDDRLGRLEREGLLERAAKPVPLALLRETPPRSRKSVLAALVEERREGR
jgi:prevent-host-death family protein